MTVTVGCTAATGPGVDRSGGRISIVSAMISCLTIHKGIAAKGQRKPENAKAESRLGLSARLKQ